MNSPDIILLSTADWDNPFWTNKQHVAVSLACRGYRVLYIDSLGLRRPSATARDLFRIARRLIRALRLPRQVRSNLWIWSPILLPLSKQPTIRRFNSAILEIGLRICLSFLHMKPGWLWTYNPLTTELLDIRIFERRIYHCVDEIKAQRGMPRVLLERAEEQLTRQADIVFATSPDLTQSRAAWNSNTHYLPNVADYSHFSKALNSEARVPDDLSVIPQPRLGYVGAISSYKLDFQLIKELAELRPEWSLVLIGQVGEGDPWTDISSLRSVSNVHLLGPRLYKDLPSYLKGIDVALLPNAINEYTDSMFPMKFFEYLAAGRPVVSVDLKAIREFRHIVFIANSASEFVSAIDRALAGDGPSLSERLSLARAHTYVERTQRMLDLVYASGSKDER